MAENEKALQKMEGEEDIDMSPFFQYLSTDKGHEVAKTVLTIIDDIKKATVKHSAGHAKLETWMKIAVILAVIAAATLLTLSDKFNSTVGVLFGTLVGYIYGKK